MMDSLKNSPNASGMKWKPFLASIHKAFLNQELSSSQKQAVITGKKKEKDERYIKNWKPIYRCLIQM